jgi:hypothetical protein
MVEIRIYILATDGCFAMTLILKWPVRAMKEAVSFSYLDTTSFAA